MNSTMRRNAQKSFEELAMTFKRVLPKTPFSRKHVHSACNDLQVDG
jgi:hypothetical protein